MNQTESIKAYLEEKASKHKIAYTDIPKYQELIEGYFDFVMINNRTCSTCKFSKLDFFEEPCNTCCSHKSSPNWQKA